MVLVVDDSAVARQALGTILGRAGCDVAVAADPILALAKMAASWPEVILLDIEMPRMDGLTFLRKVMAEHPTPVVVCSGLAGAGTEVALQALEEGAVDIIAKPALGVKGFLEDSAQRVVDAVKGAVWARPHLGSLRPGPPRDLGARPPRRSTTTNQVVAIGASTGGTEAIRRS